MTSYIFFKFLHVLAAILAFGTAMLAFPFIGAFGGKEPAHVNFALRLSNALGQKAVTPLALATFALGIALIFMGDWNFFEDDWLWISTILFLATVFSSQFLTLPTVRKLIELTSTPPEPGAGGPPPEIARLVRKVRIGGTFSAVLLATITLLMIWKPMF